MATSFAAYASQYINKHGSDTLSSSQPMFFSFTTDNGSRHADTDLEDMDDPHLHAEDGDGDDPYLKLDQSPQGWLAHLANSPRPSRSRSSSSSSDAPPPELLAHPPARSKPPPKPKQQQPARPSSPPLSLGPTQLTESLLPREGADIFSLPDPRHTARKRRKHHDALWTALWLGSVSVSFVLCIVLLFTTHRPSKFPAAFLPYAILLRTVPILTLVTLLSAAAAYTHVWLLRLFAGPVMLATSVMVPVTLFVSAVWAFVGSFMWEAGVEPTWGETVGLRLFAIIPLTLSLITARRLMHLPQHIHRTSSTLTLATHMLITNPFLAAFSPALLLAMLLASLPFITAVFRLLLIGYGTQVKTGWEWHVRAWANWGIVGVVAVWLWSWAVARGALRMTAASVVGAWYFADPSLPPPPPSSTHTIHAALTRASGPSLGTICLSAMLLTVLRVLAVVLIVLNRIPGLLVAIPFASYGMAGVGAAVGTAVVRWVIPVVGWVVMYVEGWKSRVSRYVLVYCGLTGTGFWEGAGRAGALVSGMEVAESGEGEGEEQGRGQGRMARGRIPQRVVDFGAEPSLSLLTISPLTLTLPFALITYLFVAHTLGAPNEALGAALLAAATTGMVGVFCVGLVKDCADTLYLCYCIDKAHGRRGRTEVFMAFEHDYTEDGDNPSAFGIGAGLPGSIVLPMHRQHIGGAQGARATPMPVPIRPSGRPETIVPRSPLGPHGTSTGRRRETLFDANASGSGSGDEEEVGTYRGATQVHKGRKAPVPVVGYIDSEDEGEASAPQEDDELDPFKGSGIMEANQDAYPFATVLAPVRGGGHASPGTTPLARAGFGFVGHNRVPSGGAGRAPGQRMLSSTQELNMKSQFLMNMRAYGAESETSTAGAGSVVSGGGEASGYEGYMEDSGVEGEQEHGSQHAAEERNDGEGSELGPGSGFFN